MSIWAVKREILLLVLSITVVLGILELMARALFPPPPPWLYPQVSKSRLKRLSAVRAMTPPHESRRC